MLAYEDLMARPGRPDHFPVPGCAPPQPVIISDPVAARSPDDERSHRGARPALGPVARRRDPGAAALLTKGLRRLPSATLATEGSFTYMRQRLGLEETNELLVGSPFDYKSNALIYLPTDMPEPSAPYYQKSDEQALIALCKSHRGARLVLLTSHSAAHDLCRHQPPAGEAGISVLNGHAIDGTPPACERFKNARAPCLSALPTCGEGSTWWAMLCPCWLSAKLPSPCPAIRSSPARSEVFDDAFNQYAVPQSVIRFKQGFGRLIRSKTDIGVVVILDQRVTSKAYGRAFCSRSLPALCARPCGRPACRAPRRGWMNGRCR